MKAGTRYHHGDLKNALISASIAVIDEEGMEGLSIRHAVEKIGVSHAAPYRHFKNKEDLLVAVGVRCFGMLNDKINTAVKRFPNDQQAQFKALIKTYIKFAVDNPVFYRIMFGDYIKKKTGYPKFFEAYDNVFRNFVEMIKKSSTRKRTKRDLPEITALAVWSMVHGYSCLIIDNQEDKNVGSDAQINLLIREILPLLS